MKIVILGATGRIGSHLVSEAASRGHGVRAASRNPHQHAFPAGVEARALDVRDESALRDVVTGVDVIVVSLRAAKGSEHEIVPLTERVFAAANDTRIFVIGGAGPLRSPGNSDVLVVDNVDLTPPPYQAVARASTEQLRLCEKHPNRSWTYLSPPQALFDGPRTGRYRRGRETLLVSAEGTSTISHADIAVAALDDLEEPSNERWFTVAY